MHATGTFKKTRIAPTPSGFLHPGNVFSFALTAALAKKTNATVLLRIDDMDRERVEDLYVQDVFETLAFMQIPFQEGPLDSVDFENNYSQLQRMGLYTTALQRLKASGLIYACNCSRSQIAQEGNAGYTGTCRHKNIPLDANNVSWRLITPAEKMLSVKTPDGKILQSALPSNMQDFIVRKKDGFPAYQLSSVIDDLHFGTDLVVRGQDLWPSTLAQLYLASVLEEQAFLNTVFYHHPLLLDAGNRKLSKSAGDTSIHSLRKQGYSAADVYALISYQLNSKVPLKHWEDFTSFLPAE